MVNLGKIFAATGLVARLCLSPVQSHADEFSLKAGIITDAALVSLKNQEIYNNVLFQTLSTKIDLFKYFFIGGSMTAFEVPQANTLAPWLFYTDLKFNTGLQFGNLLIKYEHGSQHPSTPYGTTLFDLPDGFQDIFSLEYTVKF
jgi:hypothetical protein